VILASKTLAAINRALESKQGKGFRNHLGASEIGHSCIRFGWYRFRWAKKSYFTGRLLRLFDRGNREEERFVKWLRDAGVVVADLDPNTRAQLRIEDHEGHFGGSLDARLFDTPEFPMQWILGEFKTHADKYFRQVVKEGVRKAQPKHYVQMQIYMHYEGLAYAMYFAINKNDDDLHIEIVEYDRATAERYITKAKAILTALTPPNRVSENPGWYVCGYCDYKNICHHGAKMDKNCRTCSHSRPIADAKWLCLRYNYELSEADQRRGCNDHSPLSD
jgi:hypothetical protein